MPKTDATLTSEISGRFTAGSDKWTGQEVENSMLDLVDNKLNKQDYSPSGSGTAHVGIAYVTTNGNDATGTVGDIGRPYLTVDAALDDMSALAYRVIKVGPGTFQSPTREKIVSGTVIVGSGKPKYNVTATGGAYPTVTLGTPTKLIGGTIFQNRFWVPYNVDDVHLADFGVDCGSDWCTASNGGTAVDALLLPANTGVTNPTLNGGFLRNNITIRNVSTLAKSSSDSVHACLVERCINPVCDNIDTWFGFAGFVSKNVGGRFTNINAHSHGTFGIVLKQNDYGYSFHSILDGFFIRGGNGLCLELGDGDGGAGMIGIKCTNGKIINSGNAVFQNGTKIEKATLDGIDVYGASGNGFEFSALNNSKITNCTVDGAATGYLVTGANTRISNCLAINTSSNGFNVTGTGATTRMIVTDNDCPGEVFVSGSHVYGNSNYYNSLTGTINAL